MPQLLHIKNLTHAFGRRVVLKNISLDVKEGEIVFLRGANGSGKTTLLRLIAQLIPTETKNIDRRKDVSVAYLESEKNGHLLSLSGVENLQIAAPSSNSINSLLARWNLPADGYLQNLPVRSYSTGMKRRLALARLELSQAKLFLLDEPTNGLDTQGVEQFLTFVENLQKKGAALIVASHDTDLLQKFSHVQEFKL